MLSWEKRNLSIAGGERASNMSIVYEYKPFGDPKSVPPDNYMDMVKDFLSFSLTAHNVCTAELLRSVGDTHECCDPKVGRRQPRPPRPPECKQARSI